MLVRREDWRMNNITRTHKYLFCLFSLSFLFPLKTFGWGETGHKATAEIAFQFLTPRAKQMLVEILGPNTIVTASVFPDEVRPDKRFKPFESYHYIEIPLGKTVTEVLEEKKNEKSADSFISHPELLSKGFSRSQRILALQYTVHVIGDMHQPLHTGNGFDRGANLCTVNWTNPMTGKVSEEDLHWVWDDKIFDYARRDFTTARCQIERDPKHRAVRFDYTELVACIMNEYKAMGAEEKSKLAALAKEPRSKWYEESRELYKDVYPDSPEVKKPEDRVYCKAVNGNGAFDSSKIPTLDETYGKKAYKIGKQRILMGGLRLANFLNGAAEKDRSIKVPKTDAFEALLNSVNPEKLKH